MTARVVAPWIAAMLIVVVARSGHAQRRPARDPRGPDSTTGAHVVGEKGLRSIIDRHLGRPYVWGSCGLKSYDCSGFVWRVMQENGLLVKRTTARKYYMTLPKVSEQECWTFGNVVFFDHLKHCGIVDSPEAFYHAAVTTGTHRSRFDPNWRRKISGVRAMPGHRHTPAEAPDR